MKKVRNDVVHHRPPMEIQDFMTYVNRLDYSEEEKESLKTLFGSTFKTMTFEKEKKWKGKNRKNKKN